MTTTFFAVSVVAENPLAVKNIFPFYIACTVNFWMLDQTTRSMAMWTRSLKQIIESFK